MNNEEITKEYTAELNKKYDNYMSIFDEWGSNFFYEKHIIEREKLHIKAIDCINKILPPELKIFIRNLCANRVGYPDEIVFYKAFGNSPEAWTKVSKEELQKKGIDITEFEGLIETWGLEGTSVKKETVDNKEYYVLEYLCERQDFTSLEELNKLNASIKLKEAICLKTNMTDDEKQECIEHIDTLLFSRKE